VSPGTISKLRLRSFRCFGSIDYEPGPGLNFLTGSNAQGKTSLLEAACVLLRLRSPRTQTLAEAVRFGSPSFSLEGFCGETRLRLSFTPPNRSLSLDGVPQTNASQYLSQGNIVWFGNDDLTLVNGPAERRRRLLDSAGLQLGKGEGSFSRQYGNDLKAYERALRSRNLLLREGKPRRLVEAYNSPLAETGDRILAARSAIVESLIPLARTSCRAISGEELSLSYVPGSTLPMHDALEATRDEEERFRQTRIGPQRDDFSIELNGIDAGSFASEGQRRTVAVALKIALASLLHARNGLPPLLLLDDVFGELDDRRRNALLANIPPDSQALLTTADPSAIRPPRGSRIHRLDGGILSEIAP